MYIHKCLVTSQSATLYLIKHEAIIVKSTTNGNGKQGV